MTVNDIKNDQDQLFDEKLKKYEEKLVAFFTDIGEQKRVNPKFLKMSSFLFIHKKLTQKQLKELTGFSTGTISTFLSVMLGTEFFEKELIPGTHTYLYRYKGDLEDLTSHIYIDIKEILKISPQKD
jgi:DNA-binding transcriptional regulator GbsR (MarR family)